MLAAASTFLPWVDFRGVTLALWDITNLEAVLLAASGFVAIALATLALRRGGREDTTAVAAAWLAALALALADDVIGDDGTGIGAWVAASAALTGLVGAGVTSAGRPRVMLAAVVAVAVGILVGDGVLEVHPEVQIIR